MEEIKEENRSELIDILDSYFDPSKEPIQPPSKPSRRRSFKKGSPKSNRRSRNSDKEDKKNPCETNNNDVLNTPESNSHSPRRRRYRKRMSGKQLSKSLTETTKNSATVTSEPSIAVSNQSAPEITVA